MPTVKIILLKKISTMKVRKMPPGIQTIFQHIVLLTNSPDAKAMTKPVPTSQTTC
jgi:hypothetical protein